MNTTVNGRQTNEMAKESMWRKMATDIVADGRTISLRMQLLFTQRVQELQMSIEENLAEGFEMAAARIRTQMEVATKEATRMISVREEEER